MSFKNPRLKSTETHQFSQVPKATIQRSSFDRSHGLKTTFDSGYLVPIFVDEALPGDTFNLKMDGLARLNTPIYPILDNAKMETFFFSVPIRLLWDNWEKFNGAQTNPGDSTDFSIPIIASDATGYPNGGIYDYLGLPTEVTASYDHSALYNRAYNLIWNEWFRDQNLQNSVVQNTDDGPDTFGEYSLLKRGKRHDYFTSALPWPQKGDSVDLPLGSTADIHAEATTGLDTYGVYDDFDGAQRALLPVTSTSIIGGAVAGDAKLYADLSTATASTINEIRQAFQIQKLLERDARGGTRYTEIIRAHFGVTSPDARLQRPEYLGGGSSNLQIQPVASTNTTIAGTSPQGTLAAVGTAALTGHGFTKSFTEHCILIGLVNVRADLTYQQGLPRQFSRSTRYDFYWPALANIGEQTVLNKEIYTQGTAADDLTFGYQERYAEYRYKPSQITGKMRSNDPATLDAWHLAQDFSSLPALNTAFIEEAPPFDRVVAVPTEPDFLLDTYFSMRCVRPMPLYGVPGMIDHF